MKIVGLGIPELLIITVVFVLPIAVVLIIVWLVLKLRTPVDEKHQASTAAYQRLAQLDDLRKRGAITEEEFAEKKNHIMGDL